MRAPRVRSSQSGDGLDYNSGSSELPEGRAGSASGGVCRYLRLKIRRRSRFHEDSSAGGEPGRGILVACGMHH